MPPKLLIGIVDDDADIPPALSSLVRSLGYRAKSFTSARQLLDNPNLPQFSCIISDIHMPLMNGLELAIKLAECASGLPVILMTGRVEPGLEEKAYACGAVSFVTKPFSSEVLSENLAKALAAAG